MSVDALVCGPATALAAAIRARQLSPREVVDAYLARIERLDPALRAYVTVTADAAREAAREAERRLAAGEATGPLFGVPVAVKDQFWTRGVRTTHGSRAFADHLPAEDATVVRRLASAGLILLGKLSMSELALGGTRAPPWGTPRNPWDPERTPGESSSGSGVALAAHLCGVSVGEDTGGSGRTPAAYCNAVGLRPTWSRVSRHGLMAACWFLDQPAPMAKTVEDCAHLFAAIAGHDPLDPTTSRRPVPEIAAALRTRLDGMRVGVVRELVEHADVHPEVRAAVEAALAVLRALGAEVRPVSVPLLAFAGAIYVAVGDTEGAGACDALLRGRAAELDPASRTRLQAAALTPFRVYHRAMQARVRLREQMLAALSEVDVLASPTSPFPPPAHAALTAPFSGAADVRERFFFRRGYTGGYALAALPAMSVPCGFASPRLPIGLQLAAAPFAEATLFAVGHAYQQATGWHRERAPGV